MSREELYRRYSDEHRCCAICHIPAPCTGRFKEVLEMAHILSRGRHGEAADVEANVLMLCSSCHGAQHSMNYTYLGRVWPNITMRHLIRAKAELGELRPETLARISGWTAEWILELADVAWPEEILAERRKWDKPI